jgi:hypothetical protein
MQIELAHIRRFPSAACGIPPAELGLRNLKAASQVMEQIRCWSKKKQPKAQQSDPLSPRYYIGQHSEVLRNCYEQDKVHLENVALGATRMAGFLPGGVRCFPIDRHRRASTSRLSPSYAGGCNPMPTICMQRHMANWTDSFLQKFLSSPVEVDTVRPLFWGSPGKPYG